MACTTLAIFFKFELLGILCLVSSQRGIVESLGRHGAKSTPNNMVGVVNLAKIHLEHTIRLETIRRFIGDDAEHSKGSIS